MARSWIMKQVWSDLLFMHIPVDEADVIHRIPPGLELDTYDGQAWIGIVPFEMKGIHPRGLPAVPYVSQLFELNVRTYVKHGSKSGVYFFSLDCDKPLSVWIARTFFHLPYYNADIKVARDEGQTRFEAKRTHKGFPAGEFAASYKPASAPFRTQPGSLEHWLTERYCLYTDKGNQLYRGDISHDPWELQLAVCDLEYETLSAPFSRSSPDVLLHYARELHTYIHSYQKL
ncbi:YqjF family protein [Ectobacillus ponti]|uniref:DUF2071 domain-containing protein n=1 Tax=Ectobacillus ponti TaxID=2961894 RepID=A0AA42BQZ0_9BACI|nr:DUF2071 domain-containing protein [Ectobacillus ponti]MCP8969881.1 DUF2071 domain-containing protein [Ectobacillus ponti]